MQAKNESTQELVYLLTKEVTKSGETQGYSRLLLNCPTKEEADRLQQLFAAVPHRMECTVLSDPTEYKQKGPFVVNIVVNVKKYESPHNPGYNLHQAVDAILNAGINNLIINADFLNNLQEAYKFKKERALLCAEVFGLDKEAAKITTFADFSAFIHNANEDFLPFVDTFAEFEEGEKLVQRFIPLVTQKKVETHAENAPNKTVTKPGEIDRAHIEAALKAREAAKKTAAKERELVAIILRAEAIKEARRVATIKLTELGFDDKLNALKGKIIAFVNDLNQQKPIVHPVTREVMLARSALNNVANTVEYMRDQLLLEQMLYLRSLSNEAYETFKKKFDAIITHAESSLKDHPNYLQQFITDIFNMTNTSVTNTPGAAKKAKFNKDKIQEQLIEKLGELERQLSLLQKNNPSALREVQILNINLNAIQEEFFNSLTPELTPQELKNAIDGFQNAFLVHVKEADKVMGHGWLYRVLEVVIKAVLGLFAGLGMVFGSVFGAGLINEGHRAKFKNTFFKWNENASSEALSQFKEGVAGTFSQFDAEDENLPKGNPS